MDKDSHGNGSTRQNEQAMSGIKKRSIISQQEVKRTLLSSADFTRPQVKPLAERLVSQKPANLTEALQPLKQGVDYASDLIHRLQDTHPSAQDERQQHANRITDTLHLLEGLHKALEKETKDLFNAHSQTETGPQNGNSDSHALYLESSTLLNTLQSYIRTLEKMKSTSVE
ncbi:hypothetical protein J7438_13675 [Thalassotalea sp. G20_0]|uniref:hypothetical protein n=1 Tax=Thalassotalea sp. G20_0 TaxID=2821093 RepID=UPI001AD9D102|nr:hypothetical protein [Thalassotalea sp. G20_0]MBO9495130.1 hypothetical protein [Thalassotalea sp. G20_0]